MNELVYMRWFRKINEMCNDANLEDERIRRKKRWAKYQYFKLNEGIHVYKVLRRDCLDGIFIFPEKKEMKEVYRDLHTDHGRGMGLCMACEDQYGDGGYMDGLENGKRIHKF